MMSYISVNLRPTNIFLPYVVYQLGSFWTPYGKCHNLISIQENKDSVVTLCCRQAMERLTC